MKKVILQLILILTFGSLYAQQDAQYTQFMFNKLSLNPGYVVATDYTCISCLHRSQWVGLEGSPTSQSANVRIPAFANNAGFGLSLNRDVIGPTNSLTANFIYGYNLKFGTGNLGIGIQGTLRNYIIDWDKANTLNPGDLASGFGESSQIFFNFGLGLYYYTPKYYVGLSIPHIVKNDISLTYDPNSNDNQFSKEDLHLYLMGGILFELNETVKLKPAVLVKYAENAPIDIDLNASLILFDKLWVGATYRFGNFQEDNFGESVDFILQYQITNPIKIGIAYDFTLSKVRNYNSGSYEVMLEYCLSPNNKRLTNPRFF